MTEFYEEDVDFEEHVLAVQRRINDGSIWHFEGSAGREAMDLIKSGWCLLPKQAHKDYWGNTVPSRDVLKKGTFGTWGYVEQHRGRSWAAKCARA